MNTWFVRAGAILALGAFIAGSAFAAPPKKTAPAAATCPACHMTLSKTKTAATPIAVKLKKGGPTYYCCSKCVPNMPAGMVVKPAGKTAPKKPGTKM